MPHADRRSGRACASREGKVVLLASGSWEPEAIAAGFKRVQQLQAEMDEGRQRRLVRLGFPAGDAASLSALHTRNFM